MNHKETSQAQNDMSILLDTQNLHRKVLIIGAGGAGLSILNAMLRAGFTNVILTEKADGIGGVWYTTRYPKLTIHTKSFNYRFIEFGPIKSQTDQATRAEVLDYMKEYVNHYGLLQYMRFNTRTDKIIYNKHAQNDKCKVYATNLSTGEQSEVGCDIVICAAGFLNGGTPHRPSFSGEEDFCGTIVHSGGFTQEMLEDIAKNNKMVAVLGAGKSAFDILELIQETKIDSTRLTWLYQKSLWSMSFDKIYDAPFAVTAYLAFVTLMREPLKKFNRLFYLLQRPLVWTGAALNPLEPDTDIGNTRFSLMKDTQFRRLKTVRSIKSVVDRLENNSILLTNGQRIPADYLICATGFERASNFPQVLIMDEHGILKGYDPRAKHVFFRNMIDPDLPHIALFTTDFVYNQQFTGFSMAAEWLSRFYSGKLIKCYSHAEMRKDLASKVKACGPWYAESEYLSKGMPYAKAKKIEDQMALLHIFQDLGLRKQLAMQFLLYWGNQERFEKCCSQFLEGLSRHPGMQSS